MKKFIVPFIIVLFSFTIIVAQSKCIGPSYRGSCKEILDNAEGFENGFYTIDPDGSQGPIEPFQVYCDMKTLGGGWTLVGKDSPRHPSGRIKSNTDITPTFFVTPVEGNKGGATYGSGWALPEVMLKSDLQVMVVTYGEDVGVEKPIIFHLRFKSSTLPQDMKKMLIGNAHWANYAEAYNFSTSNWDSIPVGNTNHHSQIPLYSWVHWNTADTQKAGGTQSNTWNRNDTNTVYYMPGYNPAHRLVNCTCLQIDVYIR